MTLENCKMLMENCLKNNDTAGAKIYEDRIKKKMKKLGIETKEKK